MPAGPLELQFPAPLAALDVKASLDGKAVRCDPVSPARPGAELSPEERRTGQLILPAVSRPALLEVSYQLAPGRSAESGTLRSTLQPLSVPGLWTGVPTRWQVDLPPGWMAVSTEGGAGASWRWGWRGWLYGRGRRHGPATWRSG